MESFLNNWQTAAITTLGLFWAAFWAFGLGYFVSSVIQVFVTRERMRKTMGDTGAKSVALGTLFGFLSSSCSFAALSTTRALFAKGAGLVPSLAFLLASTNLVIELGIVISVFLSWQFVVGEYLGGLMLIAFMWILVRLTRSESLEEKARQKAQEEQGGSDNEDSAADWKELIQSRESWKKVANQYVMEWRMVWKDVTIGFAVAGVIAAFVPRAFFEALFVGSGLPNPAFWQVVLQTLVGPIAAFFTFIGSMGNIPLAAVLFGNGVSYAGIIAFIFSDLVVFPVLRIHSQYYGWKMALYIASVFLVSLCLSALLLHYGFSLLNLLPDSQSASSVTQRDFFEINHTFFLNLAFLVFTAFAFVLNLKKQTGNEEKTSAGWSERLLFGGALLALAWLGMGVVFRMMPVDG